MFIFGELCYNHVIMSCDHIYIDEFYVILIEFAIFTRLL
jgi:hypothetical protein